MTMSLPSQEAAREWASVSEEVWEKGRPQRSNLEKELDQVRCKSSEKDFGFDLIMFLKIKLYF